MIIVIPIAALSSKRPAPGHPPGKVENNRCSSNLLGIHWCYFEHITHQSNDSGGKANPQGSEFFNTTIVVLASQLDNSAAYGDGNRLRAIAGAEFFHDVLDVNLDGFL